MIAGAARRLAAAGVESPRRNAELLAAHALGKDRAWLLAHPEAPEPEALPALLDRRAAREPLEYVVGRVHFAGIALACDRRALIPRPETEDLVALAVRAVKGIPSPRIADVGTGTGALALALAAKLPKADILATDASEEALDLARENAANLVLGVTFRQGTDLEPLKGERFDAIVANPPYVTEAEFPDLMPEIRDWEPKTALVAGPEGTEILARWIAAAPGHLKAGGWLAVELGTGQAERVKALFQRAGFHAITVTLDFAGIGRFVSGRT